MIRKDNINPSGVVKNGKKYSGLITLTKIANKTGTQNSTYMIILELLVRDSSSSHNFFLLNSDSSIEENTLMIFPPVLFKMLKEAVK